MNRDRVRNTFYGQAVGDALGLPAEFLSSMMVTLNFPDGFDHYRPTHNGYVTAKAGDWSDDTEHFLAMINAWCSYVEEHRVIPDPASVGLIFAEQLQKWLLTDGRGAGFLTRKVVEHPLFLIDPWLSALNVWDNGGKIAAPNGAVMRAAAGGLLMPTNEGTLEHMVDLARTTHADPRCVISAMAVGETVRHLVLETDIALAIAYGLHASDPFSYGHDPHVDEMTAYINRPLGEINLEEGLGDPNGTPKIGFTFKAAAAGYYALRRYQEGAEFVAVLEEVIYAGGDTDTNAAVAGAMMAAAGAVIPEHLKEGLLDRDRLDGAVDRLFAAYDILGL